MPRIQPRASLAERGRQLNRFGVEQARAASAAAVAGKDTDARRLCPARDLEIALSGRTLPARLYTPPGLAEPAALLVYFHGGGFVFGDLETHDALCRRMAAAGRLKVLSVAYRLAPEARFPTQKEDAVEAFDWARANAEALGVDRRRIAIGGDSAGSYLALATIGERPGAARAHLMIYPLLQLNDDDWADTALKDARIVGRLAVQYIQRQLAEAAAGAPSLMDAVAGLPPTVIISGGALDPVRPDALEFARRLQAAGGDCQVREYSLQPHGFLNLTHLSEVARQAAQDAGELLAGALAR